MGKRILPPWERNEGTTPASGTNNNYYRNLLVPVTAHISSKIYNILQGKEGSPPFWLVEETEAQGKLACPRSHSWLSDRANPMSVCF